MIIDLTVSNFLSIKDKQTVSLFAERNLDKHIDNIAYLGTNYGTLKTCAVMGANASGKTNLLFAFKALGYLITKTNRIDEKDKIKCYDPFLLSKETKNAPTSMELEFWLSNKRYKYAVNYDSKNIYKESLYFYPNLKPAKIFDRINEKNWKEGEGITFGTYLKGGKKQFAYFPNNSYLSIAGSSPEAPEILKNVYNYFRDGWVFVNQGSNKVLSWEEDDTARDVMKSLMCSIDLGISDFKFRDVELSTEQLETLKRVPEDMQQDIKEHWSKEVVFSHVDEDGNSIELPPELESQGTTRLFGTFPTFLVALKYGSVLFIDEIESSYHSHVVELLIKVFQDPDINIHNAQLIFTTHNFNILKSSLMRKDQIWLAEKKNGMTSYSSLDEFDSSLRDNSPFEKWYDEGRLGGIPALDYGSLSSSLKRIVKD
jgi:AAA15 family ATPase/GTPase